MFRRFRLLQSRWPQSMVHSLLDVVSSTSHRDVSCSVDVLIKLDQIRAVLHRDKIGLGEAQLEWGNATAYLTR